MKGVLLIISFILVSFSNFPLKEDLTENTTLDLSRQNKKTNYFHKASEEVIYFEAGSIFKSLSSLARLGFIAAKEPSMKSETLLITDLCNSISSHFFSKAFLKNLTTSPYSSWHINKMELSNIPCFSEEDSKLILFLQNRWLAKSTGFFSLLVDFFYPCFDICVQVHPQTSGSTYARSPFIKLSKTYENKVSTWIQLLPHPNNFPLLLTRPSNLKDYLPSYFNLSPSEDLFLSIKKLAKQTSKSNAKILVDFTEIFPEKLTDRDKWLQFWKEYQVHFSTICEKNNINPKQLICMQKVKEKYIGGIRLLPLACNSSKEIEANHQFLLEWLSTFGLCANQIELIRPISEPSIELIEKQASSIFINHLSKKNFLSCLNHFNETFKTSHPQKELMIKASLQNLKGLLDSVTQKKWEEINQNKTKLSLTELYFFKISEQLNLIKKEGDSLSFFTLASHIEHIHASLSSLLEVLSPFEAKDFPSIYKKVLTSIPEDLKSMTSYGIHSSGMTSLGGIFQATKKALGKAPAILYGENTYYECINASKLISKSSAVADATEEDFQTVDLLLAQFTPVWKGTNRLKTAYKPEKITETVQKCLQRRNQKPLTLALDCTFDFINSSKVHELLSTFEEEIKKGSLNVICFRSGLKFDLFGMDNYCGAPFYMIHNKEDKWSSFKTLLEDPTLQTDNLSASWFCLSYQYALSELESYQKQVFDNTKELLNKIPSSLKNSNGKYKVIPFIDEADPTFIDITVSGSFHQVKTAALVAGHLSIKCLEKGFPLFYRISTGFYHTNLTMLFDKECSTIRLTLGLDPAQVDVLADCFAKIATLNEPYPF